MTSLHRFSAGLAFAGLCLAGAGGAYAQVSSINSAIIVPRVFNDIPGATGTYLNNYPSSITLGESGVSTASGFADRDDWYFSNDGGTSAYAFQNNDYFAASFTLTLTGVNPALDLEAGFRLINNSGNLPGGDVQFIVLGNGVIFQGGGTGYYPFSPSAGGYPGAGAQVPDYVLGQTLTLGMIYTIDPNTGNNAFQYSVNGQFAASSPGNPYFDFSPGSGIGSGDVLGGYFQIQNDPNNPNQAGQAVFGDISIVAVPEPTSLALVGLGFALLLRRRRH